ncbi:DNA repair protein RecO [Fodinicurvata sediminis]|uniref:DNA repair protein RecO n=1 Tax=Fodinicurvata sediminis TaxID=1121832 RepID=UPI001FDFEE51|nr:DNA repair protein RecO [Fodinicurvata sediminis]
MIEWQDRGIVLAVKPHGETAAVVNLLCEEHGRHAGLVAGGQGRRMTPVLQAGNLVQVSWRARLPDHLGHFSLELERGYAARLMENPESLVALQSAVTLCDYALPERQAHTAIFHGSLALIEALDGDYWGEVYIKWELLLLSELGFGLDLERCAAGGSNDHLAYVSPRSGRAVSLSAGEPYRHKLLPLPGFLSGRGKGGPTEIREGLEMTGYFLEKNVFAPRDRPLPEIRTRLAQHFSSRAA